LEKPLGKSLESPLNDLLDAVGAAVRGEAPVEIAHARPDYGREDRKGIPEVILADTKSAEQVIRIAEAFLASRGRAILSRVPAVLQTQLQEHFSEHGVEAYPASGMVVIRAQGRERPRTGGRVGVVTAGTSDVPVAEQAAVVAREMGCEVELVSDVGVAGLHRLFPPLQKMIEAGVDAMVVAAGMDGALPSVVSGLVDVPVIGLPVSTGYGFGGQGIAALLSMLQTCAPGLTVVNIDNGVGAGATAGLIANRCALARSGAASPTAAGQES
jgi:pyridinium-3,5-biscarboxylic acid mononucleotide synthase